MENQKILITGSEGFIGSHLVEEALNQGYKIRAFVWYNSFNSWGWLDTFPKEKLDKIEIFVGDVRDAKRVKEAVAGIDIIFHLAALIGIPFSYDAPESYIDTNIRGTFNILQAARECGTKRILVTSTSEVYGTAKYIPIDEKHPRQGQSPYSATKISADYLAESFYRSFNLPVTTVRPFNTYGPRQSARAIIPTIITQVLSGKSKIQLGSLYPTRDLVFVKDVVDGFIDIAKSDKTIGEEINIASQSEISIGNLANKIIEIVNAKVEIIKDRSRMRPKSSEVERLLGSNEKIKNITDWRLKYDLDRGLKETIDWFKDSANLKRYKLDIYNV